MFAEKTASFVAKHHGVNDNLVKNIINKMRISLQYRKKMSILSKNHEKSIFREKVAEKHEFRLRKREKCDFHQKVAGKNPRFEEGLRKS